MGTDYVFGMASSPNDLAESQGDIKHFYWRLSLPDDQLGLGGFRVDDITAI